MPRVVFSADDFGLARSVNEAVERAHIDGVLGQASLMVAAPAAADAVARTAQLPGLDVGLHLVLVDGDSVLGHSCLPHITTPDGKFRRNQLALGFQYFFSPAARRELTAEIRAQFCAYAATGLTLHHADAHKHMHLHPTVGELMIKIGREFGLNRIRVPAEPPAVLRACGERMKFGERVFYVWTYVLRRQARREMLASTDHVFGIKWSGQMTAPRVAALLQNLPDGSCEIYFHPAARLDPVLVSLMPGYQHVVELNTLLDLRGILDQTH